MAIKEKKLIINIDGAIHRQFKSICASKSEKMSDVVRNLIKRLVDFELKKEREAIHGHTNANK